MFKEFVKILPSHGHPCWNPCALFIQRAPTRYRYLIIVGTYIAFSFGSCILNVHLFCKYERAGWILDGARVRVRAKTLPVYLNFEIFYFYLIFFTYLDVKLFVPCCDSRRTNCTTWNDWRNKEMRYQSKIVHSVTKKSGPHIRDKFPLHNAWNDLFNFLSYIQHKALGGGEIKHRQGWFF